MGFQRQGMQYYLRLLVWSNRSIWNCFQNHFQEQRCMPGFIFHCTVFHA